MAPRKERAAATPPAQRAVSEPAQQKATHFLDLGDDIFSKIYACSPCEDRKALRHSCTSLYRSPAVNAHISKVRLCMGEGGAAEGLLHNLAAFPVHAALKSVTLVGGKGNLESIMECAFRCSSVNAAARERCQNVEFLELQDFSMPRGAVAALLTLLWPKMREPAGNTRLKLNRCSLDINFLSVLSTQSQLKELSLVHCEFAEGIDGLMPLLGAFPSLSTLNLHFPCRSSTVLQCVHLNELQRLQTLDLRNVYLVGLDEVLPKLSSLQHLFLVNARFPACVCLQSDSLQSTFLGTLFPTFPEISVDSFPALQCVDFTALDLRGLDLEGSGDAQKVQQVKHMVTWLARCPLELGGVGKLVPAGDGVIVDNDDSGAVDEIRGKPEWSGQLCDLMLEAISPLKEAYVNLPFEFQITGWTFSQLSSLSTLCSFLPSIVGLLLKLCKFENEVRERGFMELVKQLPRIEYLSARVDHAPRDTLAALAVAQRAGRRFDLILRTRVSSCHARLQEMVEEWKVLKESLSTGLQEDGKVQLIVKRL